MRNSYKLEDVCADVVFLGVYINPRCFLAPESDERQTWSVGRSAVVVRPAAAADDATVASFAAHGRLSVCERDELINCVDRNA